MKKNIFEAIAATIVAGIVFISCGRAEVTVGETSIEDEKSANDYNGQNDEMPEEIRQNQVFVHVCGQVKNPGVYSLDEGARVYEAVEAAGGFSEDACEDAVNLVEILEDGQKVLIPSYEQAEEITSSQDGRISINKASLEDLCTIPGIGNTRAQAIIDYRTEYGRFEVLEDLMNVQGIKEGTFEKIKEYIKL